MMKRTYPKLLLREVNKTKVRFFSILIIVFIGTGFLCGLWATTPDMLLTADTYYDSNNIFDLDIKANLGFDLTDIDEIAAQSYVQSAMPAYVTDLSVSESGSDHVARIYGVPLSEYGTDDFINGFVILEGRLPESPNECLIASPNNYFSENSDFLGKTYSISVNNKNYENIGDVCAYTEMTVVGVVKSPHYMSVESEPSTVGNGQVNFIIYVPYEFFNLDAYTDVFVTLSGAKALNAFEDEYEELIDQDKISMDNLGEIRAKLRRESLVNDAQAEIDDALAELNQAKADLYDAKTELAEKTQELIDAKQNYESQYAVFIEEISDQRAYYESVRAVIGESAYQAAVAAIEAQEQTGLAEFAAAKAQIDENEIKLDESRRELADAESEIAEKETEIAEAQNEIYETAEGKWYIFDRYDTVSFTSYKSNSNKIAAIAKVFPVFFFFVAALVALTTMTRLVEEQRMQIGTLKALGYSNAKITAYYIAYSIIASSLGSLAGALVGSKILPEVITNAYTMMYSLPEPITKIWTNQCVIIGLIAITCTTAATLAACLGQLSEKPCSLMLPRPPKAGKRILLERIPFIWKRMSFIHKVTARNIFRYKKRFYMTVCGIAGCCALLVTGFGLLDSISDIVRLQFDEIYKYNTIISLNCDNAENDDEVLRDFLNDKSLVSTYGMTHSETAEIQTEAGTQDIHILVPKNTEDLPRLVTLRTRAGKSVDFDENSFILTEKLSETLGVKIGDVVTVTNADGVSAEIAVTDIVENYVYAYAYTSNTVYKNSFGDGIEYKTALVKITDESESSRETISRRILQSDNILLLQFSQSVRDSFSKMLNNINYIIVVLIVSAAMLAFVVLFNLTNINICERKKELATIKVLGFHEKEVAEYIFREINILCLIGIVFGLIFGTWLHSFVVRTAEVDAVMFGRTIYARSYIISAAMTVAFGFLVDLLMLGKLKKVNMVESMKANE